MLRNISFSVESSCKQWQRQKIISDLLINKAHQEKNYECYNSCFHLFFHAFKLFLCQNFERFFSYKHYMESQFENLEAAV